ncbi:molybdopterin-dependent oxidoreductase [Edaphobacter bradus]|uniref:molybdopterin-dependent oxidoreductase n=1 Tax=Edaphobacter bradus TaxID=2259016 RepID=UPI0021E0BFD4|nr:molybdopterin-dependent oxidoreductase [Edaphobacter bradus]
MRAQTKYQRREFLQSSGMLGFSAFLAACKTGSVARTVINADLSDDYGVRHNTRTWARYPEKCDLIMLADRPPLLETPMHYFLQDLTPNEAYFVRWHYAGLPTRVDLRTFRVQVIGAVNRPLQLSFDDLRTKCEPVTMVAFSQCAGNSRSFFRPQVPGAQWTDGAMGNARYVGARLKDVLKAAEVKPGAVEASFRGLDVPPLESSPHFEKPLTIDYALNGDSIIAYEMNGEPMPMLNGFPVRLVVPGWFATYWVKALSQITVRTEPLHNFWVDTGYRIPAAPEHSEDPKHPSEQTIPLTDYPTRAIIITPEATTKLKSGATVKIEGIAVDNGAGIRRVEVSTDGGRTWTDAALDRVIDKYSWRRWRMSWQPAQRGRYSLQSRATNASGETQPGYEWNHGGYHRRTIQTLDVEVVS